MRPEMKIAGLFVVLTLAVGCTTSRRYVTHTVSGVGGGADSSAPLPTPAAPEGAEGAEGAAEGEGDAAAAAPAAAPAPPAPTPTASAATRWMFIAYAEVIETNFFITKSLKTTSKVLRCLINDDNTVTCAEQAEADRLFNPGKK